MRGTRCRAAGTTERTSDHPRACGELYNAGFVTGIEGGSSPRMRELDPADHVVNVATGSSPRMRGTRRRVCRADGLRRIIPAHAGNSAWSATTGSISTDHPRACGELATVDDAEAKYFGSSPRMRGTLPKAVSVLIGHRDHPRACGELFTGSTRLSATAGSSPRMRGTLETDTISKVVCRIIPAHAGNLGRPARGE